MRIVPSWLIFVVGGCAAHVDESEVNTVIALDGDADAGARVYRDNCGECHGRNGTAVKASNFPRLIPKRTDSELIETVLTGPWVMPNFVSRLQDQQVADVVAYLRATWDPPRS